MCGRCLRYGAPSRVSDRPSGPWHFAVGYPWMHIPPLSRPLCRPLGLFCAMICFRVRPLFQVRLCLLGTPIPSGSPAAFGYVRMSRYACDFFPVILLPREGLSIRVRRRSRTQICTVGNVYVAPPPVGLFSEARAWKKPTEMELSLYFRVDGRVSDRPQGPWHYCRQRVRPRPRRGYHSW